MKAAVTVTPGNPEVILLREVMKPKVKPGWVLIRVKAFGLNRSELFTRRGDSPGVEFPRIQGIECVGYIEEDPSNTFAKGQKVAALMGGMGRFYDGGYAEFTLVPLEIVLPFESRLPWHILGAIPEMFQTVSGSLNQALEISEGETLLIRGGTSSIGMLACQLAKTKGLTVLSTTRTDEKVQALKDNGADHVVIDDGEISSKVKTIYPEGVNKVLELIGTRTLKDSLKCIKTGGMVCMTGILGNEWTMKEFTPMGDIPSLGKLTVYMGESSNLPKGLLQEFIDEVEKGSVKLNIDKVFTLEQVPEAHRYMEENKAKGKIVVELK
ncbi:zinc-binding alcohol dehydrogenase family protein [Fulvivirga sedimenti]|uniref:Zinc-binding alcohol dehydrogenase family protein n=1 Tax=Fulvivirga sedimenti TaxID=2879465 RepID=A0A9X1HNU8_9BACT|nr:zinc-binding alcohol dehydrogenase family protein [Fulvivirga sedimenti]MCA6075056.1 zinc-binding alcohol dehydrogenase family protein [Fulvivirga sedimenti]MCA6076233.1 zinc-binding alcohol dehydrogenase family protein [Fulvivirga sedimenti]MCA6077361.1 zinc-binding alcohol dehydrogenase family protein [Fulvivirga sedimenti]